MALKFQYNKTALQDLKKQLAIRQKALPILQSKETALRIEVKKTGKIIDSLLGDLKKVEADLEELYKFWVEFPDIVRVQNLKIISRNIVGIQVPQINEISFKISEICWFNQPAWIPVGMEVFKQYISMKIKIYIAREQLDILHTARKKTTQKVNLYEKVQIPAFNEAILKIKRFLEDKENISKAAQKIMKKRKDKGILA